MDEFDLIFLGSGEIERESRDGFRLGKKEGGVLRIGIGERERF